MILATNLVTFGTFSVTVGQNECLQCTILGFTKLKLMAEITDLKLLR